MSRIEKILSFLEDEKNDPFLYFALAQEYEKQEQLNLALENYILLIKNFPNYVGTYYHLGKLYEELNQQKEALSIYNSGIDISSVQGDHHAMSELKNAKTNCELDL